MTISQASPSEILIDDAKAHERFQKYKTIDPYHEKVPPALLNSAHIHRYALETGMISPYRPSELKSASYKIRTGARIIRWDDEGKLIDRRYNRGEFFELPQNSIVFVETEEKFRLPEYMAIRFNLKIELVHKGILLGTGPLVDPGFEGRLLIPLHNLTSNTYQLYSGQTFVWVEFTKTSLLARWRAEEQNHSARESDIDQGYVEFPKSKTNIEPQEYLSNAFPSEIRSSIPDMHSEATRKADRASIISYGVIISVIALVVSMLLLANALVSGADKRISDLKEEVEALQEALDEQRSPQQQGGD